VALAEAVTPVRRCCRQGLLPEIVVDGRMGHCRVVYCPLWGKWPCKIFGAGSAKGVNGVIRDGRWGRHALLGRGGKRLEVLVNQPVNGLGRYRNKLLVYLSDLGARWRIDLTDENCLAIHSCRDSGIGGSREFYG
jgi:hypothetical protein